MTSCIAFPPGTPTPQSFSHTGFSLVSLVFLLGTSCVLAPAPISVYQSINQSSNCIYRSTDNVGQFYESHNDYIPLHAERFPGVRILTVYMYLNDVEQGGGTHFPRLGLVRLNVCVRLCLCVLDWWNGPPKILCGWRNLCIFSLCKYAPPPSAGPLSLSMFSSWLPSCFVSPHFIFCVVSSYITWFGGVVVCHCLSFVVVQTVEPKRGRAVIWPSVLDEDPNQRDDRMDHTATPVIAGVKYGANAWVHQRNFKESWRKGCHG